MIIAVDAAGGEYAPHQIVKGAIKAAQEYNVEVALVGKKGILHVLAGRYLNKPWLNIIDAEQIINFHESPIEAVNEKPNSSIVVGTTLVRDGVAQAFVSAGNTGAVVYSALLTAGKTEGIERPAIGSVINIDTIAPALLIDAGANANCRPSFLVQFARLGNIYAREIFGVDAPRVGLLNNGQEETKGNRLVKESHELLKQTNLNFIGNIEGQDILRRAADVIVTDGFTGNIVLKTMEGFGDTLLKWRQAGRSLLYDVGLGSMIKGIDYQEYGGASLLGVNGNFIIAHGRSQAKAIRNAIGLAKQVVEHDICQKIKENMGHE
jgi:glycerol-3-phosphate acyltransferase PlsX